MDYSKPTLFNINEARYNELRDTVKAAPFADKKSTIIKSATSSFAFNCAQVWGLISTYTTEGDQLKALPLFNENMIDPENRQKEIADKFAFGSGKKKAAELLAGVKKCFTEGDAPEKLPPFDLPYTSRWTDSDFDHLIKEINGKSFDTDKIKAAQVAIVNRSAGLTSEQAVKLFKAFKRGREVFTVAESIHDRLMGVTCAQTITLIKHFNFSEEKLAVLKACKKSINDFENKSAILDAFDFSSDKEKAREILKDLRPKSYLFGVPNGKVLFVIDLSSSMACQFKVNTGHTFTRLDFVKSELAKTIRGFDESIEFNIFPYAETVAAWKGGLQRASQQNINESVQYINQFNAAGGTNTYDALQFALKAPGVQTVYFLTDGAPNFGAQTNPSVIIENVKKWHKAAPGVKINSIAFLMGTFEGDNKPLCRSFVKDLADITGGVYRSIESDQ